MYVGLILKKEASVATRNGNLKMETLTHRKRGVQLFSVFD